MPTQINGLPAHVLLIHVVIVFVPLAAAMVIASAVWPAARRKLGFLSPAVALVALVFVPVTVNAGQWLQKRLPASPAIKHHAELGHTLLPWVLGLFLVAMAVWLLGRRVEMGWRPRGTTDEQPDVPVGGGGTATAVRVQRTSVAVLPLWAMLLIAVVAVAVSIGSVWDIYRIGDAGAKIVWSGVGTNK